MTEPTRVIDRLTLLVPGSPETEQAWGRSLAASGIRFDGQTLEGDALGDHSVGAMWIPNDGHFGEAFSFGTVDADGVRVIDDAGGALVLNLPLDLREGRDLVCGLVTRLRSAGALAVRVEQSKLGWDIGRWLELLKSNDPGSLHRAVVTTLVDGDVAQTCGMHAFSLPDVRIDAAGKVPNGQQLASIFNVYQIAEDPELRSGETFAPDEDTPRRVIERWPDREYPSGHPCHNPYGVWKLGPPGGAARALPELEYVFVPALLPTLIALQGQEGAPLKQARVEAARDQAPCIAMETADAQHLERSRGYADLNPELVWAQWQLVRGDDD